VLYYYRAETAGVKFNDADLLGFPVRIVVSPRNLKQGSAEAKQRSEGDAQLVGLEEVVEVVQGLLRAAI